MLLRFIAQNRSHYKSLDVSFSEHGETQEVSKEVASRLLETFPDWFQEVSDSQDDDEETDISAPDSNESGAETIIGNKLNSKIFDVIKSDGPIKLTDIASQLDLSWQGIRSNVSEMVSQSLIEKDYESRYTVKD
tara:strand:+ start:523 stop:924 length:402 start_codon:yes stop_codon:yes gene_type:complete